MKKTSAFWMWIVLQLATTCTDAAETKPTAVFLLIGQSNMAGRAAIEPQDRVPHPRVWVLNKDLRWVPAIDPLHYDKPVAGVGLGSTFGRVVADADPSEVVGLVPAAVGGSSIDEWMPGEPHYLEAVRRARVALETGELKGILWHQGEADSTGEKAAIYAEKFGRMIATLRDELGDGDVPVVVGETCRARPGADRINAVLAGLPAAVPVCAFVSAEDLSDRGDKVHFDAPSLRELGRRYAVAWLNLMSDEASRSGRRSSAMGAK